MPLLSSAHIDRPRIRFANYCLSIIFHIHLDVPYSGLQGIPFDRGSQSMFVLPSLWKRLAVQSNIAEWRKVLAAQESKAKEKLT